MKVEKTDTTTIICIEPDKDWYNFTENTILIEQEGKVIKLEEPELKALERAIGGRFKQ